MELACAVSRAGGLPSLALTWTAPADVGAKVRQFRERCEGPLNANFVLAFSVADQVEAALDAGAQVISFFWGDPARFIPLVHDAGAVAIAIVGRMDEAFKARDAGVDALVVQGLEAGGHVRGSEPRDALLEAVARGTPQIPLCAAGGVASAAAAARVRALGADAVWVGTRFVATVESGAHPLYKQKLVEARAEDTALSMLFDGDWPNAAMRTLRNSTFRNWERAGRPLPGSRPGEGDILGMTGSTLIPRYHSDAPLARTAGEIEAMALYAGTGVDAIREVRSAREVLVELASAWAS